MTIEEYITKHGGRPLDLSEREKEAVGRVVADAMIFGNGLLARIDHQLVAKDVRRMQFPEIAYLRNSL